MPIFLLLCLSSVLAVFLAAREVVHSIGTQMPDLNDADAEYDDTPPPGWITTDEREQLALVSRWLERTRAMHEENVINADIIAARELCIPHAIIRRWAMKLMCESLFARPGTVRI